MNDKIYSIVKNQLNSLVMTDDSSVNYSKSEIGNDSVYALTLDDLQQIYIEEPEKLFRHNTRDIVRLILNDDTEISLHEYREGMDVMFIKLTPTEIRGTDNEIIIGNHFIKPCIRWQNDESQIDIRILDYESMPENKQALRALEDYNGFANTKRIMDTVQHSLGTIRAHAAEFCTGMQILTKYNKYYGYLPSLGQLAIFGRYLELINFICRKIGFMPYSTDGYLIYAVWTSSEYSGENAWTMWLTCNNGLQSMEFQKTKKSFSHCAMPFFSKKKACAWK